MNNWKSLYNDINKILNSEIKHLNDNLEELENIEKERKLLNDEIKYKNQLNGAIFEIYTIKSMLIDLKEETGNNNNE